MRKVFYLCRGRTDSNQLYFAPELPENYFAPGLFVIEASSGRGGLDKTFGFAARQSSQILDLELRSLEDGRGYVVDAEKNGKFFFKAVALSRQTKYAGSRTEYFEGFPLFRLEPANMQHLERACRRNDFYFIGGAGDADV